MSGVSVILLTNGMECKVSDEDMPRLSAFNWVAMKGARSRTTYAGRVTGRQTIYMHRVIAAAPKGLVVDHINKDGLDNRRENLRVCTSSQNNAGCRWPASSSGYRGVYMQPCGTFQAVIYHQGRKHYLGTHSTALAAARAYDAKALEIYGDFASLNFPRRK